jgi:hypothetical protein
MNIEEIEKLFEQFGNNFELEFDNIKNKLSNRPDLHAFLLLDSLISGNENIISNAQHDQYWLCFELEDIAKIITKEQIEELVCCGVHIEEDGFVLMT